MASTGATTSSPGTSLWERAHAELTQKERDQLTKAGIPSRASSTSAVLKSTKISIDAAKRSFQDAGLVVTLSSGNGRKVSVRDVFRRASEWLNIVTSVGDKFIQFDVSGHAALPWAGVNLLVNLITADVKKYDGVLEGLATIVHNLTFYGEWQRLYGDRSAHSDADTLFQDALVRLYTAILRYQADALKFFDENRLVRIGKGIGSAFLQSTKFQDQLDSVVDAETEVYKISRLMDADMIQQINASLDSVAVQMKDLASTQAKSTDKILQAVEGNAKPIHAVMDYIESQKLINILDWYSTAPFQSTHDGIYEKVIPGTGTWLLSHEKYQAWKNTQESAILWLHGTMGMGKSSLASIVVKDLEDMNDVATSAAKTAFFYIARERTSNRDVWAALARQLAASTSTSRLLKEAQEVREIHLRKGILAATELAADRIQQIVVDFVKRYTTVWLVLDAIDESEDGAELHQAIQATIQNCATPIKVFLTSRESSAENPGLSGLYKIHPHISIREGMQSGDIATFVDAKMSEMMKKKKLLGSIVGKDKQDIAIKVRNSILTHADGMFRWAEMRLIELSGSKYRLRSSILKALDNTPQALSQIYDNIYHSLQQDGETIESRVAKALLSWMIYAQFPLEEKQLMSALRIYCNAELEEDEVNIELLHSLLPGFFQVVHIPTNHLSMLQFAHLSVREHFEQHEELSEQAGHAVIAVTCLRRLNTYAKDFMAGTLSTVIDVATWRERWDIPAEALQHDETPQESVIIGHDFLEWYELKMHNDRMKARRAERIRRQRENMRVGIPTQYPSYGSSPSSSSSQSSSESGFSEIPETAAVLSASFVSVGRESDISDDRSPGHDYKEPRYDTVSPDQNEDEQRTYPRLPYMTEPYRRSRTSSVDDIHPNWLRRHPHMYSPASLPKIRSETALIVFDLFPNLIKRTYEWLPIPDPHITYFDAPPVDGDYHNDERSQSSTDEASIPESEFLEESDIEIYDLKRYPVLLKQRQKYRGQVREGQMSLEEFAQKRYDILRSRLLKYARLNWHSHLAKCGHDSNTMCYNDAELQQVFKEFCNISATDEELVENGLGFVLWYDWFRQQSSWVKSRAFPDELSTVRASSERIEPGRWKDRWLIRLDRICELTEIKPGQHIAASRMAAGNEAA